MNKIILTGSVATVPKKVAEGIVILNMVAIGEYNPKIKRNDTDLVPVKVLGPNGDYIVEHAEVGQQIEVSGKMSSRKREDGKFYCDVTARDIRLIHKSQKNKAVEM